MRKTTNNMHINDIEPLMAKNIYLLDVREDFEYELKHLANSTLISVHDIPDRLEDIPKNKTIYVYCRSGNRSKQAADFLTSCGYDAINLTGGIEAYTGKYLQDEVSTQIDSNRIKVEASGLQCPGPLLKVNEVMNTLSIGEQMEITVTDFGFCADIEAWAKKTGHTVLKNEQQTDKVVVILQKNQQQLTSQPLVETKDGATMVVFSGDLDKALASFIIATGAKSMGKEVTMFFTFWGLNIIKNPHAPKIKKSGLDKIFSKIMPNSTKNLPISKMNMFGLGSKMIQKVMKNKKVDALTDMIHKAEELGVKMVACTMSMDVMAIDRHELLPSVEIGGVGSYLGDTEHSNLNLFI